MARDILVQHPEPEGSQKERQVRLRLRATICLDHDPDKEILVFIDTGSEVNLVRRGILPADRLKPAQRPVKLWAANSGTLSGGSTEATVRLRLRGSETDKKKRVALTTPTLVYEADIEDDMILSYEWLGERGFDVSPRRHGLLGVMDGCRIWIPGIDEDRSQSLHRQPVAVHAIPAQNAPRALDLFCGTKSAARVLESHGFQVETVDSDPKRDPSHCVDVMSWDYRAVYPPGHFDIVVAAPPCTEYSVALNGGRARCLEEADAIVRKTLEIIEYLQPKRWWLETPRTGLLARRDFMSQYPFVDCDHCQFEDTGYQKPTRFFGSSHLAELAPVLCDFKTCLGLVFPEKGSSRAMPHHRNRMGGNGGSAKKEVAYHIPSAMVEYVTGLTPEGSHCTSKAPVHRDSIQQQGGSPSTGRKHASGDSTQCMEGSIGTGTSPVSGDVAWGGGVCESETELAEKKERVRLMRLRATPWEPIIDGGMEGDEEVLEEIARRLLVAEKNIRSVKTGLEPLATTDSGLAKNLREALMAEFGDTSLSGIYPVDPPVRGPFGEGQIWLMPEARPVSMPPFQLSGERRDALDQLVATAIAKKKLEPGVGAWNTPAFPVPKKVLGSYRLVQDLRPQNAVTVKDGHPLPRIGDMVHRQGKNQLWTVLDLVDGFHQMPMKKEDRHITCMSTPRGTQQWRVQVMGLKNAGTQFQRMMEWVLRDLPHTDPYVDDTITGAKGPTPDECLWNNYHAVRALLLEFRDQRLVCSAAKSHFFQSEVEFCGHILKQGRRSPAPGKLFPIQNWELPQTVTELRGFLGLTNYFSEYVSHYAGTAAPLMGKLQLDRKDGKKGSKLRLVWTDDEVHAFQELKRKLCEELELWQPDVDKPFRLHCDASDYAIGAELAQQFDAQWRPVAFYSRKLAKSQNNWAPREKETYAIVAALRKWSGLIGFQPTLVTTDHKALEDWVTEHVDTPSGPRGRRARWHETLSQFDLKVQYVPGPENVVPDALSRWAYPASSAREDVSFHGSAEAREEVKKMLEAELAQNKVVGLVRLGPPGAESLRIAGAIAPGGQFAAHVHVVTRSALDTDQPDGGESTIGINAMVPPGGASVSSPQGGWKRSSRRRRDLRRARERLSREGETAAPAPPCSVPLQADPAGLRSGAAQRGAPHANGAPYDAGGAPHGAHGADGAPHAYDEPADPADDAVLHEADVRPPGSAPAGAPPVPGHQPGPVPSFPAVCGECGMRAGEDGDGGHWVEMGEDSHRGPGPRVHFADPVASDRGPEGDGTPIDENFDDDDACGDAPLGREPMPTPPPASPMGDRRIDLGFRFAAPKSPPPQRPSELVPRPLGEGQGLGSAGDRDYDDPDQSNREIDGDQPEGGGAQESIRRGSNFRFAAAPPGSRVGGGSVIPPSRLARGGGHRPSPGQTTPPAGPSNVGILDADWSSFYDDSPTFAVTWQQTRAPGSAWPEGYKLFNTKLYFMELLCVPEDVVEQVLTAHHEWMGHVGTDRLALEVSRRYIFPDGTDHKKILQNSGNIASCVRLAIDPIGPTRVRLP